MTRSSKSVVLAAVLVLTTAVSTPASAQLAQQPLAPQFRAGMAQGWVVSVHRGNGLGTFQVRTAAGNNNIGGAANLAGAAGAAMSVRQFVVGPGTHFEAVSGGSLMPASFASLRSGQRIMVQAQGQQALGVRIIGRNPYAGGLRRVGYIGPGRGLRVSNVNQVTQGLAATPNTARTSRPLAVSTNRTIPGVPFARAAKHGTSKKR